ncbi:MAG: hypothetical protein LQ351_007977 [Letrouitia transgressa]|nr:MAG: hypothetical protein LQ351_007977 [Letrouitia transgressa]
MTCRLDTVVRRSSSADVSPNANQVGSENFDCNADQVESGDSNADQAQPNTDHHSGTNQADPDQAQPDANHHSGTYQVNSEHFDNSNSGQAYCNNHTDSNINQTDSQNHGDNSNINQLSSDNHSVRHDDSDSTRRSATINTEIGEGPPQKKHRTVSSLAQGAKRGTKEDSRKRVKPRQKSTKPVQKSTEETSFKWSSAANKIIESVSAASEKAQGRNDSNGDSLSVMSFTFNAKSYLPQIPASLNDCAMSLVKEILNTEHELNFQRLLLCSLGTVLSKHTKTTSRLNFLIPCFQDCESYSQRLDLIRDAQWVNGLVSDLFDRGWGVRAVGLPYIYHLEQTKFTIPPDPDRSIPYLLYRGLRNQLKYSKICEYLGYREEFISCTDRSMQERRDSTTPVEDETRGPATQEDSGTTLVDPTSTPYTSLSSSQLCNPVQVEIFDKDRGGINDQEMQNERARQLYNCPPPDHNDNRLSGDHLMLDGQLCSHSEETLSPGDGVPGDHLMLNRQLCSHSEETLSPGDGVPGDHLMLNGQLCSHSEETLLPGDGVPGDHLMLNGQLCSYLGEPFYPGGGVPGDHLMRNWQNERVGQLRNCSGKTLPSVHSVGVTDGCIDPAILLKQPPAPSPI